MVLFPFSFSYIIPTRIRMSCKTGDRTDCDDNVEALQENEEVVHEESTRDREEESRGSFTSSETTSSSSTADITTTTVSNSHSRNPDSSAVDPFPNGTGSLALETDQTSTSIGDDNSLFFQSWARTFGSGRVPQQRSDSAPVIPKWDSKSVRSKKPIPAKKGPKKLVIKVKLPKRIRKCSLEESDQSFEGPVKARSETETRTIYSNNSDPLRLATSTRKSGITGHSNEMPHCEVRLLRLEEHQIPPKPNGTFKARVRVSSRGREKVGNIPAAGSKSSRKKRRGVVSDLFSDEDPSPASFKTRKVRTEKPMKNYSSYGREISRPSIYRDVLPSFKSKERGRGNISNGKPARRALFDSSRSRSTTRRPSSIDSKDSDSDDSTVVPCPSPFRYSSEGSPSSATGEFDKENYLERYIRPGPNHQAINTQMIKLIDKARSRSPEAKIISKYTLTFKQEHLARYDHLKWLDDPNIDFYLEMIRERNNTVPGLPRVYVFHCFFYKLFNQSGYDAIKETTAKDDIFTFDLAFFPVIIREHWRLIVADFRVRTLKCYDSMFRANDKSLEKVKDYLVREYREKRGPPLTEVVSQQISSTTSSVELSPPVSDTDGQEEHEGDSTLPLSTSNPSVITELEPAPYMFSDWTLDCVSPDDIPQQKNGSDCGIFLCQYAEYLSRDVAPPFDFNQRNMPYFRVRMAFETITGNLLQPLLSSTSTATPATVVTCCSTVSSTVPGHELSCNGTTSSCSSSSAGSGN